MDKIYELQQNNVNVRPVTMLSLKTFNNMGLRGTSFKDLCSLIDRYWKIIKDRQERFAKKRAIDTFVRTKASFDEIYDSILTENMKRTNHSSWIAKNIKPPITPSQAELDENF